LGRALRRRADADGRPDPRDELPAAEPPTAHARGRARDLRHGARGAASRVMRGRNVLVAGGTGLVGSALTRRLDGLGAQVLSSCHDRPPPFLAQHYRRFDFTELADCLDATRGIDDVFICAAQTFGAAVMHEHPESVVLPNVRIGAGLLEACRRNRVARVLLVSSSTVYQEASHPIA